MIASSATAPTSSAFKFDYSGHRLHPHQVSPQGLLFAMLELSSGSTPALSLSQTSTFQLSTLAAAAEALSSSITNPTLSRSPFGSVGVANAKAMRKCNITRPNTTMTHESNHHRTKRGGGSGKRKTTDGRVCAECHTSQTLQWRLGPDGQASYVVLFFSSLESAIISPLRVSPVRFH